MTTGTDQFTSSDGSFHRYRTWSGVDGRDKDNAYSMSYLTYQRQKSTGRPQIGWLPGWVPIYGPCPGTNPSYMIACGANPGSSPFTNNHQLALLGKLAEAAKTTSFNGLVFTAQIGQVYSQTLSTVQAIGKSLWCLKHGNLPGALRALSMTPGQRKVKQMKRKLDIGDISGTWLAMSYGWLPTISDLHSAWEFVASLQPKERSTVIVVTQSAKKSYEGSTAPTLWKCPGVMTESRRIKYTLTEQLSIPRQLGLTDPATLVWEILPFSFVLDWFLPVGSYLENLAIIPKLKGTWVQTNRIKTSVSSAPQSVYCGGSDVRLSGSLVRSVGTDGTLSVPPPSFNFPEALKGKRIFHAVALAHQLLR